MFEDQNKKAPSATGNPASGGPVSGIEDIFSDMESGAPKRPAPMPSRPGMMPPPPQGPSGLTPPPMFDSNPRGGKLKKILMILGIIIAVVVLFILAWLIYAKLSSDQPRNGTQTNSNTNTSNQNFNSGFDEVKNTNTAPNANTNTAPEPVKDTRDTDSDGLTDAEETKLGTDPKNVDSDDDGLFDNEEVSAYKTDPLNKDTDGDTYLDADEVQNGFNPLGPGKLNEAPKK